MRLAVVGHVEWVDFLVAAGLPQPGEILHVRSAHEGAGGGGAMAALGLRALAGGGTFFCAIGDDDRGARAAADLRAAGLEVHAAVHPCPQRRCITFLTDDGERTITVLGERLVPLGADPLPCDELASYDGVLFMAGDADALRAARAAPVLVVGARAGDALREAGVRVDALVGSAEDPSEHIDDELAALAGAVVQTEGRHGGRWRDADGTTGRWAAQPPPGTPVDAYGCGDCFAAALLHGLAAGQTPADACELGARVGAALLCERAPSVGDLARLLR